MALHSTTTYCVPPAALADFSFKRRGRELKYDSPHTPNHHPSPSNQPCDPVPPSLHSSVPHLLAGCLISPTGSRRPKTIVPLFNTGLGHFATIINTFSNGRFRILYYKPQWPSNAWLCAVGVFLCGAGAQKPLLLPVVEVTALRTKKRGTTWAECLKQDSSSSSCV